MLKPTNKNTSRNNIPCIPLDDCLAKTICLDGKKQKGVSVKTHSLIAGYVARELLNRLPLWLRKNLFPSGSELVAAAHDVGKVSPAFQEKLYSDIGHSLNIIDPALDEKIGYHYTVSQATVYSFQKYIPEILGRHHGISPNSVELPNSDGYGGKEWQKQRIDLLEFLKNDFKTDWPNISSELQADVISGLTTVSDWISSGSLFDEVNEESWKNFICKAVDQAGFVAPIVSNGLTFDKIFEFSPRNIQKKFMESIKRRGIYILEAPMGIGKTEAALYAAYQMLEKGNATGIYFALPTQLTSDKIYERMNSFLEKILDKSDSHRHSLLLHGSAWLRDTELGEEGAPGHSCFNSAKRGLLAPFAVGTIDTGLMSVMNVNHGVVRT
ncbi:CRISPR-associated helicase, Cas3 [Candidatus Omnitrophus magneticus]|uniref:CRISPR-associated helicase, Cas3 n=1 Tax=Candidatus Omnitrophus magneticus TaxID=1609969 RepID=A0A0F0CP86_9BACT|nr:CRISPR-associated helicase, Cas3 [Candidatus Omnitrophus magneticus]